MVEPFLEGLSLQDAISMNKIYICDLVVLEGKTSFFLGHIRGGDRGFLELRDYDFFPENNFSYFGT